MNLKYVYGMMCCNRFMLRIVTLEHATRVGHVRNGRCHGDAFRDDGHQHNGF